MKIWIKYIIRVFLVALCAGIIELFILNWHYWEFDFQKNVIKNVVLSMENFTPISWVKDGEMLVSEFDCMLLSEPDNMYIKTVEITADFEGEIPYIDFFYTNEKSPIITDETSIRFNESLTPGVSTVIEVDDYVEQFRIDLSDNAGIVLKGVKVTINKNKINFSFSRFFVMNMIYWGTFFLFKLQRPPKYEL